VTAEELDGIVSFLRSAERLKATYRSAWTSNGDRESVAAHTWRLCLLALLLADDYPEVDVARLIRMLIVHDLGEALHGDIPAPRQDPAAGKAGQERVDLLELLAPLPEKLRHDITRLWDEYDDATTPEARLAKGLDKLETIMQHIQGRNPADFDYSFNLEYGRAFTTTDPLLAALRKLLDAETARRAGLP
jgi:5'-deoxynucleotidase YfbR-like HD superfamily hydrolase